MKKQYEHYSGSEVTKELLDSIKADDLIKINNWKKPLKVRGISDNYFVMTCNQFGKVVYSVCEKKRREAGDYNAMRHNMFHVSREAWVFGWISNVDLQVGHSFGYSFDNKQWISAYLKSFEEVEDGQELSRLSERAGISIEEIWIKRY